MEKKRKACAEGEEGDPQAENARLQQQLQELTAENAQLTKLGSGPVHFAAITPSTVHPPPFATLVCTRTLCMPWTPSVLLQPLCHSHRRR